VDPPAQRWRTDRATRRNAVGDDCRAIVGKLQAPSGVAIEESADESAQAIELGDHLGDAGEDLAGTSKGGTHKTPPAGPRADRPGLHTARSYTDGEATHSS